MYNKNLKLINALDIPYFESIKEFSRLLGLSTRLIYLLTNKTENYYKTKKIPKNNGKTRTIFIPSYTLKIVQRWILNNILYKLKPSDYSMAFRKNTKKNFRYDIKQNAFYHLNTLYGLSIDLCDFFPSITSNKVYQVFKDIGYNSTASTILTNLCTLDGVLPQGAVCSPALSNLICVSLDSRLVGLCAKRDILYTRYADDMYFSCDNKGLLLKIFPVIESIIKYEGFEINKNKLHFHTPRNKKLITGIVVVPCKDKYELKASKQLKKRIRAEIFRCIMTGMYDNTNHIKGEISYISFIQKENSIDYKQSIIDYINRVSEKIVYFPELVRAYNENFFYQEQKKIKAKSINNIDIDVDKTDIDEYNQYLMETMEKIYKDRKKYLLKNNLFDICKYEDWPDFIISK